MRTENGRFPNFLIIGAMKAGTTSLFHYIQAHPQVFMSSVKELDFFIEEGNWQRGLEWYQRQFRRALPDAVAVGEASTSYTKFPRYRGVPERIAKVLPDVRLIYLVRDPIARIRSHYQHRVAVGVERAPFEEAIRSEPIYVDFSRYATQLEQYLEHFQPQQILVLASEELRHARRATMRRVYEFLQVDSERAPDALTREFYETAGRATYSPAVWWVRRRMKRYVPASKRAKELVDSVLPRYVDRLFPRYSSRDRSSPFHFPESVRSYIADLLRNDVQTLRAHMPSTFDGWGIG